MSEEMGIFEVMFNCRAMRRLKPDPIPEELLKKLVDAGNHAPTGSNVQNVRWVVVRDPETKRLLAEENRKHITAYMAADPVVELPHHSQAKRDRMREAVVWQMEHMHEIPALVIACLEFPEPQSDAARAGGGGYVWPAVQNVPAGGARPRPGRHANDARSARPREGQGDPGPPGDGGCVLPGPGRLPDGQFRGGHPPAGGGNPALGPVVD